MSLQDALNIFLIIGLVTFIVSASLITYFTVKALKAITSLANNIEETTANIKDGMRLRALAALPALLMSLVSKFVKKGR